MDSEVKRILVIAVVGLVAVVVVLMIAFKSNYSDLYGPPSARASTETATPSTKKHHSGMGGSAGVSGSSGGTTSSIIEELENQPLRPKPPKFSKKARTRFADLALIQFEEGKEAGRIALRTSREWRIYREWQRRIEANGGSVTLFFDDELGKDHRKYKIAIDGAKVDGTLELTFYEGVWHVIAVRSADEAEDDPLNFWRELIDTDESTYDER